jgi:hypothetical protein
MRLLDEFRYKDHERFGDSVQTTQYVAFPWRVRRQEAFDFQSISSGPSIFLRCNPKPKVVKRRREVLRSGMPFDPKCRSLEQVRPYFFKGYKSNALEAEQVEDKGLLLKKSLLKQLRELQELPPNWNGYGAVPIAADILRAARFFVLSLPNAFSVKPQIVPMTQGRLQFEWHSGPVSLEIEFESPGKLHYLKWDSQKGFDEEDIVHADDEEEILRLIQWFDSSCNEFIAAG